MSTISNAGLFDRISGLVEEIASEKNAAAKAGMEDPGGHEGPTASPLSKTDDDEQAPSEGAQSAANTAIVKDTIPASVDSTVEATPANSPTVDDSQQGQGVDAAKPVGEDSATEDDYKPKPEGDKRQGDMGGTTHPADGTYGEKYSADKLAAMSDDDLCKLAAELGNDIVAEIANGHFDENPAAPAASAAPAAPVAPVVPATPLQSSAVAGAKLAEAAAAPSDEAAENLGLMGVKGRVVGAGGNTVADSLRLMRDAPRGEMVPEGPFALATCHRLETITKSRRLRRVIELLNTVARELPVVFVTHKPTRRHLRKFGLETMIGPGVALLDMLDYCDFVGMIKAAKLVLTDGGSIQEECAYLNKPCLVLRKTTERPDGIGANARLWGFDADVAGEFLAGSREAMPTAVDELPRPSARIVDEIVNLGYANCGDLSR